MPIAIGFRATGDEVYYAVTSGTKEVPVLVSHDRLRAPAAFELPDALRWYRNAAMQVIAESRATICGVRVTEPLSGARGGANRAGAIRRQNIEGVLMEATASAGVQCQQVVLKVMTAKLGTTSAKGYLQNAEFRGIPGWGKLKGEYKEAVLTATTALALLEA